MKGTDDLKKIDAEEPLRQAAIKGDEPTVRRLLEAGVNVNAQDSNGHTALTFGAYYGHEGIVRCLLEAGANVDHPIVSGITALHLIANEAIAGCLIEAGADVDSKNNEGRTPLHIAAIRGHKPTMQCLLEAGANPTCPDNGGNIPRDLLPYPPDPVLWALLTPVPGVDYGDLPKAAIGCRNP